MGKRADHRRVADFGPLSERLEPSSGAGLCWHPVLWDETTGIGSAMLVMAPGARCNPGEHLRSGEAYVVEGDLVDGAGARYQTGDRVPLVRGARHHSLSPSGCKLVVFQRGPARGEAP
ncbi:MAG: cupin [Pseudomonadota bacterium]